MAAERPTRYSPFQIELGKLATRFPGRTALTSGAVCALLIRVPFAAKVGLFALCSLAFFTFFVVGRETDWIGRGLEPGTLDQPINWRLLAKGIAFVVVAAAGVALVWLAAR